jgi:hypothetical protein
VNKIWLRTISVLEIIGGTAGIFFVLIYGIASGLNISLLLIAPIILAINISSLLAGIYLWKRTNFGRTTSIIIQFIQLPKISSSYLIFAFSFGFDIFPTLMSYRGSTSLGFQFRVLTDNQLYINTNTEIAVFGISILAIIFLFKLFAYSPELDKTSVNPIDLDPPSPDKHFTDPDDTFEK